jgi:hypothetical protein
MIALAVLLIILALASAPWLMMLTIGIAFHNWGWPSTPLSFVESIPFALFLLFFVAGQAGGKTR